MLIKEKNLLKRITAFILSAVMIGCSSACSENTESSSVSSSKPSSSQESMSEKPDAVSQIEEKLKKTDYGGVVYIEIDGEPYFTYAEGMLDNKTPITIETPMPIGSVSKQFCAASILLLQEQGKLSTADTLDKYFPEYEAAGKITLHNMLSMRSGIPEYNRSTATYDVPEEANISALKEDIFGSPTTAEPDTYFEYSNTNYFLLALIVQQVSGMNYVDFVDSSFWQPLNMTHTGSLEELPSSPEWAQGSAYEQLDKQPGLTKGAGDIISNAADMTIWLNSLREGRIISKESFEAMITDYSDGKQYGYAFRPGIAGGAAHAGENGIYTSFDYINTDKNITLFMTSNTESSTKTSSLFMDIAALL